MREKRERDKVKEKDRAKEKKHKVRERKTLYKERELYLALPICTNRRTYPNYDRSTTLECTSQ